MSDEALIGMQSCGCITYANAAPDRLDRHDQKAIARILREGGQVIRTTSDEARKMPHFLVSECPHDPKGWEREPYVDPAERITTRRNAGRDLYIVYQGGYRRLGEVRKWDGAWEVTRGWFNYRSEGANDGREPRGVDKVVRPFGTRKEAVDALSVPA